MIPDQDPYYSAVKELADVECSQKMIDDLLRSIKTDTKSLTSVQSNTLPAVYRTPYVQRAHLQRTYQLSAQQARFDSLNLSRKECFDTVPQHLNATVCNAPPANITRTGKKMVPAAEQENEGDRMNISQINRTCVSPYEVYDRDFVRGLINRLSGDNQILHSDSEDCMRTVEYLCEEHRRLQKSYRQLQARNRELERKQEKFAAMRAENARLKAEIREIKSRAQGWTEGVRQRISQMLEAGDEGDRLLAGSEAENEKLRLMMQLANGQDIPAEATAILALPEQKVKQPKPKSESKAEDKGDSDDIYERIAKAEAEAAAEPTGKRSGEEGNVMGGENVGTDMAAPGDLQGDMLRQFLSENEIVERIQDGGDAGEDEEGTVMFNGHKRRDSF